MPKRFAATESAIEKVLENASPKAGASLVEGWLTEIEKDDISGSQGLQHDLERLHKELSNDTPDADKVQKILGKLGPATLKLADKADGAIADKVRHLGESLQSAGTEGDDGK